MKNRKEQLTQILSGVKVLDFGWGLVGAFVTKQLADFGAQVIRVESITHLDFPRTSRGVKISRPNNPDDKPFFTHFNTSKYSIALDLKHPRAKEVIERLIRWADVVNANFAPGRLGKLGFGYEYISKIKPDIIMAEGSVYGQTGPLSKLRGADPTGAGLSGYLDLTGWPDRSPVLPAAPYGDVVLPFFTAMAIIAALKYRRKTGKGQYIDASMFETCVQTMTPVLLDLQANKYMQTRNGNRIAYASPHGVFPCRGDDKWCAITVFTDDEWQAFCNVIGNPLWTKDPKFASLQSRKDHEDELEKLVAEWTMQYSPEEVMQIMQAAGVPAGAVQNVQEIMEKDPQMKERNFLIPLKHPVLGVFNHPNPPYKLSKHKVQIRTSPCLGEHTEYVCTQILGMSDEEFMDLSQACVFR